MGKLLGPGTEKKFNELGGEGWEFVATATGPKVHYAIFKRQLSSASLPPPSERQHPPEA